MDSWPALMQEGVKNQMDTVEAYERKNGMHEDEGDKELNL